MIIQQIKQSVDIVAYISKYTDLKQKSGYWQGKCPFHEEKTGSFCVYTDDQRFHCYGIGCGASGDIIDFVSMIEKIDQKDAIKKLADELGIQSYDPNDIVYDKNMAKKTVNIYLMENLKKHEKARDYIINTRGMREEEIEYWQLGIASGTMKADLEKMIGSDLLTEIGVLSEDDQKRRYDYISKDVITAPVYDFKGQISHWTFLFWDERKGTDREYQAKKEHREVLYSILNIKDLINHRECYIVEGIWDANHLYRRNIPVCAILGKSTRHQIDFLKKIREKGHVFPETKLQGLKKLNIWLDRDANLSGQHAAEKLAGELFRFHDTVICIPPEIGMDPDDLFTKTDYTMGDLEFKKYNRKTLRIEETDEGYLLHKKENPVPLTNFCMTTKYRFVYPNGKIKRQAVIWNKDNMSGKDRLVEITGDDLSTFRKFKSWIYDTGNFHFSGESKEFEEFVEYQLETDMSKEVYMCPAMGRIRKSRHMRLFHNAVIDTDEVIYGDRDGIIWYMKDDITGIMPWEEILDWEEDENARQFKIPEGHKWMSMREIVEKMVQFFPPYMVRQALGYATIAVFRSKIANWFSCFPLLLLFGPSERGKTHLLDLIRSFVGSGKAPVHSCDSTGKSFLRHIARFKDCVLHLTEYEDKFFEVLRNLYDLNGYNLAKRSQDLGTVTVPVNACVGFTCESTPKGQSLLNRAILFNYHDYKFDKHKSPEFDEFHNSAWTEDRGIGFLVELIKTNAEDIILDRIHSLRKSIIKEKWTGISNRILKNYAIVYGGFITLYELFDLKDIIPTTKDGLLTEMKETIEKNGQIILEQDKIRLFFSLMQTLFLKGWLKDTVSVREDDDGNILKFNLDSVFHEVKSQDRRGDNILGDLKRNDVESGVIQSFAGNGTDNDLIDAHGFFQIPVSRVMEEFGFSFKKVSDYTGDPNVPF